MSILPFNDADTNRKHIRKINHFTGLLAHVTDIIPPIDIDLTPNSRSKLMQYYDNYKNSTTHKANYIRKST